MWWELEIEGVYTSVCTPVFQMWTCVVRHVVGGAGGAGAGVVEGDSLSSSSALGTSSSLQDEDKLLSHLRHFDWLQPHRTTGKLRLRERPLWLQWLIAPGQGGGWNPALTAWPQPFQDQGTFPGLPRCGPAAQTLAALLESGFPITNHVSSLMH